MSHFDAPMRYNEKNYLPTWQTWRFVVPRSQPETRTDADAAPDVVASYRGMRERVQIARIEQRMTVADIADHVACDVDTIVAFENGDEILSSELQQRIRRVLRIDP